MNIQVAENQLPTCTISARETVGSWLVYAYYEDTGGCMKGYEWTVDGELMSISSDRLTIGKYYYERRSKITLVGIDDSGGRSEAVTLN